MKKRVIVIIFILIITIVFFYNFVLTNYKKIIKDEIGIDVSSCKLTNKYNTKGSFGDGEYVVILDCGKSETLKKQLTIYMEMMMKDTPLLEELQVIIIYQ